MTKEDFLRRWAKRATAGGAAEAFERDVEVLVVTTVRMSVSAVVNGMLIAAKELKGTEQKIIERVARRIPKDVESALRQLYE